MSRYDDINPMDIDPDTGRPYANYSSPSLDTSFHDFEMAGDMPDDPPVEARILEAARARLFQRFGIGAAGVRIMIERDPVANAIVECAVREIGKAMRHG